MLCSVRSERNTATKRIANLNLKQRLIEAPTPPVLRLDFQSTPGKFALSIWTQGNDFGNEIL